MSEPNQLETPQNLGDLILVAGEDVEGMALRPLMTGDVLRLDDGRLVALTQHPCAIRSGTALLDRLLACEVVVLDRPARTSWADEPFYRMLIQLVEDDPRQIDFRLPVVLTSQEAVAAQRVAILERSGVNLLLQRWVNHNSRFVALTVSYDQMCTAAYTEVELVHDALDELVPAGVDQAEALTAVDGFLRAPIDGRRDTWQARLRDPQHHGPARRALDAHVRALVEARS